MSLAFADNMAWHTNTLAELKESWQITKEWSGRTQVKPNPSKCGIIIHKANKTDTGRLKQWAEEEGIPVVKEY